MVIVLCHSCKLNLFEYLYCLLTHFYKFCLFNKPDWFFSSDFDMRWYRWSWCRWTRGRRLPSGQKTAHCNASRVSPLLYYYLIILTCSLVAALMFVTVRQSISRDLNYILAQHDLIQKKKSKSFSYLPVDVLLPPLFSNTSFFAFLPCWSTAALLWIRLLK